MFKKIIKWLIVIVVMVYFSGLFVHLAFANTKERKAKVGWFLFGLKKLPHIKMLPQKDKVTSFKIQELTVPMNGTYRFYKTAEIFNMKQDNWFYSKGLRSGDFIMSISLTYKNRIEYFDIDNLHIVSMYDIIKAGYKMDITVFRVIKWTDKNNLISAAVKIVPMTFKKGR